VTHDEGILVSDLFEDATVTVPQGQYNLYFETGYTNSLAPAHPPLMIDTWCCLSLLEFRHPEAQILHFSVSVTVPLILRTERVPIIEVVGAAVPDESPPPQQPL